MAMTSSSLINDGHLAQMKNALDQLTVMANEIDLAERAGINVAAQKEAMIRARDQIQKMLNVYFPGQ